MAIQYVVPVGTDHFRKLVTLTSDDGKKSLFVDKTKFIKEVLNDGSEVILITRPRRFGKTINMSMLQHFLSAEVDGLPTKDLFNDLLISQDQAAMAYQGKFPVIFITFKDAKGSSYAAIEAAIRKQIKLVYKEFRYLLDKQLISKEDQLIYQQMLDKTSSLSDLINSIVDLSEYIYSESGVTPYLLIDEYDTPIHSAYSKDYYADVLDLIRAMLCTALKGNANIKQGILTGITRIAKESIFSELNNLVINSLLDEAYAEHFGFTELEVDDLFNKSELTIEKAQIKDWYNGYTCGNTTIYNPWSIMNCIKFAGKTKAYWIGTSGNDLAINLMLQGGIEIYEKLEALLENKTIIENIDEHIVYQNINENRSAIWTLLLMTGYLKIVLSPTVEGSNKYELALPNKEVRYFYQNAIQIWLSDKNGAMWYQNFLEDLLVGKLLNFEKKLLQIVQATFSVRDVEKDEPEKFYHAFMLGLLATLQNSHDITSNREAGLGYDDFLIIPKDVSKNGVILEFKAPKDATEANLIKEAAVALQQIKTKKYAMELEIKGVKNIISIGIAFAKKDVRICFEKSWIKPMADS